jgi:hypothetical protein
MKLVSELRGKQLRDLPCGTHTITEDMMDLQTHGYVDVSRGQCNDSLWVFTARLANGTIGRWNVFGFTFGEAINNAKAFCANHAKKYWRDARLSALYAGAELVSMETREADFQNHHLVRLFVDFPANTLTVG